MSRFSPIQYSQDKSENIDLNNYYIIEKSELEDFRRDYQEKKELIRELIAKIDNLTRENTDIKNKIDNLKYNSKKKLSREDKEFVIKMMQCDW
jgi:CHASE3 domain sensor protein